jgi:hypothetical protein
VAEQLGQAELVLQLNDKDLRKGLEKLRAEIEKLDARPLELTVKGADTATKALKNISTQADTAATRVRTLNQLLNDFPSGSYSGLSAQIKKLSQETLSLQLNSDKYLQTLTRIKELEGIRQFKAGRQAARAGEAAYGPGGALGQLDQSQLPQLPITLEGQAQNIRELQQRLRNLNYESADYAETLRVLQRAQREYDNTLSGTSSTYRELEQAEERAIRRAEKLQGIQQYYADKNPRAGGIRDDNGAMLARGAGSAADERAYNASLRPSQQLLEQDLQRVQALRQVTQRLQEQAALLDQLRSKQGTNAFGSFGEASASNFSASDPVSKSIRRNQEKVAKREDANQTIRDQLNDDLARVTEARIESQRQAAEAAKRTAAAERKTARDAEQAAKERTQRRKDALGNAVIGGAFPLLFGQGLGASIGGGLGGAAGGLAGGNFGFGLSLVGTAVGQQFDVAIQKLQQLGNALSDPVKQFSALAEAGLISTRGTEKQIQALIDTGREAEAAALTLQDLSRTYGDLSSAKELADQTDRLTRSYAQLSVRLAEFLSGPAAKFIEILNRALGGAPGGTGSGGQPQGIGFGSFRRQVDQISRERGRDVGARLVRQQLAEEGRIVARDRGAALLGDLTFGLFGKGRGARSEEAAKRVLDRAAAEGVITKEQEKQLRALNEARTLRTDLLRLGLQLTAADAQGNKTLVDAIKLTSSYKKERLDLLALTPEQRSGPRGDAIRERAQAERQAIREQAKAAAESSARELKNAKELVGLYGSQRQIKEEQQKISEALRQSEQAKGAAERAKRDPNLTKEDRAAAANRATAAENNYNKVRIEGLRKIQELQRQDFADRVAATNRLADLQEQINIQQTRAAGGLTGAGISALQSVAQLEAAKRAEQNAQAQARVRPGDPALQNAVREAAKQTELAAATARADLIEGAKAAEESVKNIRNSLQDAVLAQQSLVGGNQGLNAFIPGQAAYNRQAQANAELQATTRAAKQEFINSLGPNADPTVANAVNRREFSGTLAEQNAQMVQFIESIRQEIRGAQGIDDLNKQLVKAQNDLVTINTALRDVNEQVYNAVTALAEKNWTVNVNVPGGSASGDVVGAVNSRS